jgi:hypothetical protein
MSRWILSAILCLWASIETLGSIEHQFNMYETEQNVTAHHQYYDCLLYYVLDNIVVDMSITTYHHQHQIIPYCMRPSNISNDELFSKNQSLILDGSKAVYFRELSRQGVSSQQLLSRSASIDLAERYQIYLNNPTISLSQQLFYNCLSPWFGPQCQYRFINEEVYYFDEIVKSTYLSLKASESVMDIQGQTCYIDLKCIRSPSLLCLDWREVCDGKVDCLDGDQDEKYCFELEMSECDKNEYRCRNGMQCVPLEFFNDNTVNPDCIDRTDELYGRFEDIIYHRSCNRDPSFRCEEHSCQPDLSDNFVCGDGECSDEIGKCHTGRQNIMTHAMRALDPNGDTDHCRVAMTCITWQNCPDLCSTVDACTKLIRTFCKQSLFVYPTYPFLFGHVRFIFSNNRSLITVSNPDLISSDLIQLLPDYVCYNKQLCGDILPVTTILLEGLTCRHIHSAFKLSDDYSWENLIYSIKKVFYQCSTIHDMKNQTNCSHSSLYQCANSSKCISKYRLRDGVQDCYENDDETLNTNLNKSNSSFNNHTMIKSDLFPLLCDGYIDMQFDDTLNETDETNCNWWPCNNIYTQCNKIWNCHNGLDEINCSYLPSCSPLFHPCISPDTFNFTCLSIDQAGNGVVNCVGGSDEPYLCRHKNLHYSGNTFRCWNESSCLDISTSLLCDGKKDCLLNDDERLCNGDYTDGCLFVGFYEHNEFLKFLCQSPVFLKPNQLFLLLRNLVKYPEQNAIQHYRNTSLRINNRDVQIITVKSLTLKETANKWQCNRGIHVWIRKSRDITTRRCLCPPAYYGDFCQYQSQRVSLTLQFKAQADWRTTFTLVITLVDQQQTIESYDQIQYLAIRDCNIKFNLNLLYSTRSKNIFKNYTVRIDAYDRHMLMYRASWIFPIIFPFLPVYRIAAQLIIPIKTPRGCINTCNHGRCIRFSNKDDYDCQCDPGWTGPQCTIFQKCYCSPDSLCVVGGWPSICICPLRKFGPRCYLIRYTCQPDSCEYHGQCIETDERMAPNNFTCLCHEGYSGETCQHMDTNITITFHGVSVPQSILGHFIMAYDEEPHIRTTTIKKISFDQDSVSIYTSNAFHLLFIQFANNYYLAIAQEKYILSAVITTKIIPSQRCPHINELFNSTVLKFNRLRRIKLYHLLCQQPFELKCFYDETFICLCDIDRFANCFDFNHSMTYNCQDSHSCENGAQCFQDKPTCPTKSMCSCDECFYGTFCQFSTIGFALSLDAILGYKIRPHIAFAQQSMPVKISASLAIILFVLGLISSIFSIFTFQTAISRKVGCGLYLLSTSIISLLTMIIFLLKFFILIYTQITLNTSRSFLHFNCVSIDFLLRVLLSTGDWLNACVAVERVFTVYKAVSFNQKKSKSIARWIITIVILVNTCSVIHDPIHRRLMDDTEEQRTWCITSYSSAVKLYDTIIFPLHFFIPFFINIISAFITIITIARQRSILRTKQTHKEHLYEQLHQNKHLLISPFILVLLALPRPILAFLSGCMKSPRDPWRFLISYFVSFIPSILTFVIFVLPSEIYKKEFMDSMKRFRLMICRYSYQQ